MGIHRASTSEGTNRRKKNICETTANGRHYSVTKKIYIYVNVSSISGDGGGGGVEGPLNKGGELLADITRQMSWIYFMCRAAL